MAYIAELEGTQSVVFTINQGELIMSLPGRTSKEFKCSDLLASPTTPAATKELIVKASIALIGKGSTP